MLYALELFFDAVSEERIRSYWRLMDNDYLVRVHSTPHVTIGVFEDIPLKQANETLRATAKTIAPFPVTFQSIGMFTHPGMHLFLTPVVTQELLDFHVRLFEQFSFCDSEDFAYYRPGQWVPHCTICSAQNADELACAVRTLTQAHEPFTAQVTHLAWIEIAKPIKLILKETLS